MVGLDYGLRIIEQQCQSATVIKVKVNYEKVALHGSLVYTAIVMSTARTRAKARKVNFAIVCKTTCNYDGSRLSYIRRLKRARQ